jgi:DNA repair exonuclease SbcCD nuclease subunit
MKEKFGIISDTHYHNFTHFSNINKYKLNTRLVDILDATREAFDAMIEEGCKRVYHCGDIFHVRGKLSPSVLNPVKALYEEYSELIDIYALSGNHDLESADSEWLTSSASSLATKKIIVANETNIFEEHDAIMIPWFNKVSELKKELERHASKEGSENTTVFIHAPLNDVIMGIPDNGLEAAYLETLGFKHIFCGHYHNHKNFNDVVFSVGALTHQSFSDIEAKAGYLIVDDKKVTHHVTSAPKFVDIGVIDDEDVVKQKVKNNYARIRIGEATDIEIAQWKQMLGEEGALGVQVIATPKTEVVGRSGAITGTHSLQFTISQWIDVGIDEKLRDEVNVQAQAILGVIE